jgi:hypothetical protein
MILFGARCDLIGRGSWIIVNGGCRKCQDGADALGKGHRQALLFEEDISLNFKINTPS